MHKRHNRLWIKKVLSDNFLDTQPFKAFMPRDTIPSYQNFFLWSRSKEDPGVGPHDHPAIVAHLWKLRTDPWAPVRFDPATSSQHPHNHPQIPMATRVTIVVVHLTRLLDLPSGAPTQMKCWIFFCEPFSTFLGMENILHIARRHTIERVSDQRNTSSNSKCFFFWKESWG